jgi:hypothetical protein
MTECDHDEIEVAYGGRGYIAVHFDLDGCWPAVDWSPTISRDD